MFQEKARLKRAREKAKQKALLKKQQQQSLEESPEVMTLSQEPLSNIAIAIDPTYNSRRTELQDIPCKYLFNEEKIVITDHDIHYITDTSAALSSSLDDVPPYMPIQGQRRNNQADKKKKSKTSDGVASFFKVFK